jgi:hypothetical protein
VFDVDRGETAELTPNAVRNEDWVLFGNSGFDLTDVKSGRLDGSCGLVVT